MIRFEWDSVKAIANLKAHGVSFEEARSVFYDEFAVLFHDDEHSDEEDRFILLGMSSWANLLVVCHCERRRGTVVRIISARKATANERKHYGRPKP